MEGFVDLQAYQQLPHDLSEGNLCEFGRFTVVPRRRSYRTVDHLCCLKFAANTLIKRVPEINPPIPLYHFSFVRLEDIRTAIRGDTIIVGMCVPCFCTYL
jgi:hypothetical protein